MKATLKKLVHDPAQFTPQDAEEAVNEIMKGSATPSQISAFLVSLKLQHKDSDPEIVAACANAMRSHARLIPYDGHENIAGNVVDIVGTGGDGHDTYNVSTTASVVAAGAGAKVAKVRGLFKPPCFLTLLTAWKSSCLFKIRICRPRRSTWLSDC